MSVAGVWNSQPIDHGNGRENDHEPKPVVPHGTATQRFTFRTEIAGVTEGIPPDTSFEIDFKALGRGGEPDCHRTFKGGHCGTVEKRPPQAWQWWRGGGPTRKRELIVTLIPRLVSSGCGGDSSCRASGRSPRGRGSDQGSRWPPARRRETAPSPASGDSS